MNQPPNRNQPDPHQSNHNEQLVIQQAQEETERLRQENQHHRVGQRRVLFARIVNSIYFLVGLLEVLLGMRLFLRIFGANPDNIFAQTIYGLSNPFVAPFSTLFISPVQSTEATLGENIFDVNLLIAMIIYAVLCSVGVWIIRYIQEQIG
ncbi:MULTISPECIES: YggT family protein [Spirulina sp. CCY15215]|uniref:YggT family protein n=1 Tax=Spirulina sp. CCY15215 TaxID=2767591 RepID=UPI001951B6D9|nr:YggT family protein [Spirulina major]